MQVSKKSPVTGKYNTMDLDVTFAQMAAWQGGKLIQDAFPNLSADEREFLLTGYTPEDWDKVFPKEDE